MHGGVKNNNMMRILCTAGLNTDEPAPKKKAVVRSLETSLLEVQTIEAFVLVWLNRGMPRGEIALAFQLCFTCRYTRINMYKLLGRMYQISREQVVCLFRVYIGRNVFITGPAGTGKSFIMCMIHDMLIGMRKRSVRTASTGTASVAINGQTIHSFTGIGIHEKLRAQTMDQWRDQENYVFRNFNGLDVLMLDEISMINGDQFNLIEAVPRFMHNDHTIPAAGTQFVVSGDFLQLPPVKGKFAFQSDAWHRLALVPCCLKTSYRQANQDWFEMLCKIRKGQLDGFTTEQLLSRMRPQPDPNCCRLYSKRDVVRRVNVEKLAEVRAESYTYYGTTSVYKIDKRGKHLRQVHYYPGERGLEGATLLDKYFKADHKLEFKIGCRVMLVQNDVAPGVANGSVGTVLEMQPARVIVQFDDAEKAIAVETVDWETVNHGVGEATCRRQIPLILAYAITIHKAQGMGLTRARTSLRRTEIFQDGQAYVSLSRIQSLDGLDLEGFDSAAVRANPLCLEFYQALEED